MIVGVFETIDDAQHAFEQLQSAGFSRDDMSFVANKARAADWVAARRSRAADVDNDAAGSEIAADAGIGAALGGVGGLLLTFASLAVPGVGPVLAAGPIIAALGGAGIGAAAGGLIGALTETGVPEERARYYAEGVRRGDVLITVQASGERADNAARILERGGAIDIDDRVSVWRSRGWSGFDPNAPPLSAEELRREHEYFRERARSGQRMGAEKSQSRSGRSRRRRSRECGKRRGENYYPRRTRNRSRAPRCRETRPRFRGGHGQTVK